MLRLVNRVVLKHGGVVQLVRTSACHAEGREFESRHSRHFFYGYAEGRPDESGSPVTPAIFFMVMQKVVP